MIQLGHTGGATGEGSALVASFSARSALAVEGSTARQDKPTGQDAPVSSGHPDTDRPGSFDGSAVRAATLTSERPVLDPAPRADGVAAAARTTLCNNCGDPIIGRKPEAKFCSACRCERDTINESRRSNEGWVKIKADPQRHARRLEHRRVREFDRRIDEPKYRTLVNERQRLFQHHRHVLAQMERDCVRCGLRLGVKYVGPKRRLSNRVLHTWCAKENRRQRQFVFSQIRREARELARRVAA